MERGDRWELDRWSNHRERRRGRLTASLHRHLHKYTFMLHPANPVQYGPQMESEESGLHAADLEPKRRYLSGRDLRLGFGGRPIREWPIDCHPEVCEGPIIKIDPESLRRARSRP